MGLKLVLLFLATLLSTSHARFNAFNPIQLLRPRSATVGLPDEAINDCLSWQLAVETNNLQHWDTVPQKCTDHVRGYMLDGQYGRDYKLVADAAIEYAESVKAAGEKDVWIFDIDETLLSNLCYYKREDVQFGSKPRDTKKFLDWVKEGKGEAKPEMLHLYNEIQNRGFKIVILTGLPVTHKNEREKNLKNVGYEKWEKLIFKEEKIRTAKFKSDQRTKLVKDGDYRIVGNVGDQWGDLTGANVGNRTFKVPNPMYYI